MLLIWSKMKKTTQSTQVLKEVILPLAASSRSGERRLIAFERECKLLERINHPRIARLEEHFIEDTRAYMVLEYVRGASIDKLVRTNGPLPEEQVVDLANAARHPGASA